MRVALEFCGARSRPEPEPSQSKPTGDDGDARHAVDQATLSPRSTLHDPQGLAAWPTTCPYSAPCPHVAAAPLCCAAHQPRWSPPGGSAPSSSSSPPPSTGFGWSSGSDSDGDGGDGEEPGPEAYRVNAAMLSMSVELELRQLEAQLGSVSLPECPGLLPSPLAAEDFSSDLDIIMSSLSLQTAMSPMNATGQPAHTAETETAVEDMAGSCEGEPDSPLDLKAGPRSEHYPSNSGEDPSASACDTSIDFSAASALLRRDSLESDQPLSPCTESDLHPFRALAGRQDPVPPQAPPAAPPQPFPAGEPAEEPDVADVSFMSESSCEDISVLASAISTTAERTLTMEEEAEEAGPAPEQTVWPLGLLAAAVHKKLQMRGPEAGLMGNVIVALMANLQMHHLGNPYSLFINQLSAVQHLSDIMHGSLPHLADDEAGHAPDSSASFTACQIRENPLFSGAPSAAWQPQPESTCTSCDNDPPAGDGRRQTHTQTQTCTRLSSDGDDLGHRSQRQYLRRGLQQADPSATAGDPLASPPCDTAADGGRWGNIAMPLQPEVSSSQPVAPAMEAAAQAILQAHRRSSARRPPWPTRSVVEPSVGSPAPVDDWELASHRLECSKADLYLPHGPTDSRLLPYDSGSAGHEALPAVPKGRDLRQDLTSLMDFLQNEMDRVEGLEVSQDFSQQLHDAQQLEADESFCQEVLAGTTGPASSSPSASPAVVYGTSGSASAWSCGSFLDGQRSGSPTPLTDNIMETFGCCLVDAATGFHPGCSTKASGQAGGVAAVASWHSYGAADQQAQTQAPDYHAGTDRWLGSQQGTMSGFLPAPLADGYAMCGSYSSRRVSGQHPVFSRDGHGRRQAGLAESEHTKRCSSSSYDALGTSAMRSHCTGEPDVHRSAPAVSGTAAYEAQLQKLEDSTLELRRYLSNLRSRSKSSLLSS